MWKPGSLIFDEQQCAVVLSDADDIVAAEGVFKFVTLAGGDTVRMPDTENGLLFAAAPELLAALEECITHEDACCHAAGAEYLVRRLEYINGIARQAIAKAKGETP
jgi:hypothetical protein